MESCYAQETHEKKNTKNRHLEEEMSQNEVTVNRVFEKTN
jgi:hypothetical protein